MAGAARANAIRPGLTADVAVASVRQSALRARRALAFDVGNPSVGSEAQ